MRRLAKKCDCFCTLLSGDRHSQQTEIAQRSDCSSIKKVGLSFSLANREWKMYGVFRHWKNERKPIHPVIIFIFFFSSLLSCHYCKCSFVFNDGWGCGFCFKNCIFWYVVLFPSFFSMSINLLNLSVWNGCMLSNFHAYPSHWLENNDIAFCNTPGIHNNRQDLLWILL